MWSQELVTTWWIPARTGYSVMLWCCLGLCFKGELKACSFLSQKPEGNYPFSLFLRNLLLKLSSCFRMPEMRCVKTTAEKLLIHSSASLAMLKICREINDPCFPDQCLSGTVEQLPSVLTCAVQHRAASSVCCESHVASGICTPAFRKWQNKTSSLRNTNEYCSHTHIWVLC